MSDGNFGSATAESFDPGAGHAEHIADRARQTAEDLLNGLKANAADYLELGRGKAAELTDTVEVQIRNRPAAALAVAAGIGFALGFLWKRRS